MKYAAAALLVVLLGLSGRLIDFSRLAGGFKGDEATYVLMAFSFADDFDMKYQGRDLARFYNTYRDANHPNGLGPDGIFIKKGSRITGVRWAQPFRVTAPFEWIREEVPTTLSIEYGKSFAYPLAAAPFAKLGGLGGMFVFNVLLLAACAWCAATFCRARTGSRAGAVFGAVFVVASVAPVWTAWLTPEIFNFSLVFFAYFLWLYKEVTPAAPRPVWWQGRTSDIVAATLIGIVTFPKPTHALMIAPLGLLALSRRQLKRAVVIGAVFVGSTGAFYGANLWATGEWNYQGSVYEDGRLSCYGDFPFDGKGTQFAASQQCSSKATNESNSVEEEVVHLGIVPTNAMFPLFMRNAYYFVVGRDAGLLPFFFPGLLLVALFFLRFWESKSWQWFTLLAVGGEIWAFLALAPWTWNGDGGPPGNRYFLSIYPAMLFLLPASARWMSTVASAAGGFIFTGAMTLHPFVSAKETWWAVERAPLKLLPVEKTIMNALPVRLLDNDRARISWYRETYAQFYYMDRNVYGVDANGERKGLWTRGESTADVIVRADRPMTRMVFVVSSEVDTAFAVEIASDRHTVNLKRGVPQTIEFDPGPGVSSKGSVVYEVKWITAGGFYPPNRNAPGGDQRFLGVFVEPYFYDSEHPR